MTARIAKAKEIIFREGEDGDVAYIIQSGKIEILKHAEHGEVQLAVLETGDLFGEMALFEPRNVRSATARALEDAELDVMTDTELKSLIDQCPARVVPLVVNVFKRLRDMNARLAAKERATVILGTGIEKITITSACPDFEGHFVQTEVRSANLPFSIGGYPMGEEKPRTNDLDLPSDGPPLIISQKHCQIENHSDGIFVVDNGSRFCTIVNGKVIGRGKVSNKAPLQLGENKITLGDYKSPYKLVVHCE